MLASVVGRGSASAGADSVPSRQFVPENADQGPGRDLSRVLTSGERRTAGCGSNHRAGGHGGRQRHEVSIRTGGPRREDNRADHVIRRGQNVRIAFASIAVVNQGNDGVDDLVGRVVLDYGVFVIRRVECDRDRVRFFDRPAEGDAAHRKNFQAGGVSHSGVRHIVLRRRIHHHAHIKSIRHIQVRSVPGHRHGRPHGIGAVRRLVDAAAKLADNRIRGDAILGRNLVVDQHAIVAAVGDEQPLAIGEREARKVHGRFAEPGIGGFVVGTVPFDGHSAAELFAIAVLMIRLTHGDIRRAAFVVGIEFQITTRLWPRSETKSRTPSDETETGLLKLVGVASLPFFVKSGSTKEDRFFWPNTRSAAAPFDVGMELKISTRWFCVSATKSFPFWIQTPCGPRMDLALGTLPPGIEPWVKSACPTTTSAGTPFVAGILLQISTRLLSVSATAITLPSEATPVGDRIPVCVSAMLVVVKSFWPSTTSAVPRQTGQIRL